MDIELAYRSQHASFLLDYMKKFESADNNLLSKSWIWELLQIALFFNDSDAKIKIILTDDSFEFKCTGRAFTLEELTYFIDKSGPQNQKLDEKNLYSGFLSTYFLSKEVRISGVLQEKPELCKEFDLILSRSANNQEEMLNSLQESYRCLSDLSKNRYYMENYKPGLKFDTKFSYELDYKGLEIAKKAIESIEKSILFTMAFNKKLSSVKIKNEIARKVKILNYDRKIELNESLFVEIFEFFENKLMIEHPMKNHLVLLGKNEELSIAIELSLISNKFFLINRRPEENPCVFSTIPLIGCYLQFPTNVHSDKFEVNLEKNNLYLENDENSLRNMKILENYSRLFEKILDFSKVNFVNSHYLAISPIPDHCDKIWYRERIQLPIRKIMMNFDMVELAKGHYTAIQNIAIPFIKNENKEKNDQINIEKTVMFNEFFKPFSSDHWLIIQKKESLEFWLRVLDEDWKKDFQLKDTLTIHLLLQRIASFKNIKFLKEIFTSKKKKIHVYLKNLTDFIKNEYGNEFLINLLNKFPILPNQNNDFRLFSELKKDGDIGESLKSLYDMTNPISNIKDLLLHEKMPLEFDVTKTWTSKTIINKIIAFLDVDSPRRSDVIDQILGLISHHNLKNEEFNEWARQFNRNIPLPIYIDIEIDELWSKSSCLFIDKCVETIKTYVDLSDLQRKMGLQEEETMKWLNGLYARLKFAGDREVPLLNQLKKFVRNQKLMIDLTQKISENNDKDLNLIEKTEVLKEVLNLLTGENIRKKLMFDNVVIPGTFIDLFQKFELKGLCGEIDGYFDLNGNKIKNKEFAKAIRKIDGEVLCSLKEKIRFEYFPRFMKNRVDLIMDFVIEKEEKDNLCLIGVSGKSKIFAHLLKSESNENELKMILEELEKDQELYGKIRKLIKK